MFRACALLFAVVAGSASAQSVDCANAMAQVELNRCAHDDWQAADAALNATYRQVIAAYAQLDVDLPDDPGGAEATLREAQRHWIAFRDSACAAEGFAMRGGSAEPLLVYGCMRLLTEERTAHLRGMLDALGG